MLILNTRPERARCQYCRRLTGLRKSEVNIGQRH
jgi:hypothetical protein